MSKITKINPERWYTLREIVEGEYLKSALAPWKATYPTVRKIVRENVALLCPKIRGTRTNVRYLVQGENIIKFIKRVEAGKVQL